MTIDHYLVPLVKRIQFRLFFNGYSIYESDRSLIKRAYHKVLMENLIIPQTEFDFMVRLEQPIEYIKVDFILENLNEHAKI